MMISVAGDVGVGTVIPDSRLDVNGTASIKQTLNVTSKISTLNASSYSGQVVCYTNGGELGHCTSVVGATGGCTCVRN
jgi:hypothetical protein